MYEEWVNRYEDVKVLGYTENISKYMRWADLVITKAGGITLFEILHSQVPLFVIHPFLEQEMNNARYAAEKGFAKVVWGKHEDYIPKQYLPTFSSHPIELNMHRIRGLSEQFVYFNDDTFIINKMEPEDFFRNGLPRDYCIETALVQDDINNPFACILMNNAALVNMHREK